MMSCFCTNVFAADKSSPDPALLEYLGSSVRVGKELVDPLSLQAMQNGTRQPKNSSTHTKSAKAGSASVPTNKHRQAAHD